MRLSSQSLPLMTDEALIWSGRPRGGLMLRHADALLIPFSLLWSVFVALFVLDAWTASNSPLMLAWSIPFVIAGIYMLIGRFFYDAIRRSRTVYGVTTRRVLILTQLGTGSVRSLPLDAVGDVSMRQHRDGTGTINFGPEWTDPAVIEPTRARPRRIEPPAFVHVPDAFGVFEIVQRERERLMARRNGRAEPPTSL